jgi:hypothetical protein
MLATKARNRGCPLSAELLTLRCVKGHTSFNTHGSSIFWQASWRFVCSLLR